MFELKVSISLMVH